MTQNPNLVRGTLELLILKSLTWEPLHGYGISEWIEQVTDGSLLAEEGTLYPALHRLHDKGLVTSEWGLSENNRRAKYYRLTRAGQRHLEAGTVSWAEYSRAVAKALAVDSPVGGLGG
ncbi:MAG: PadR family transcriptional regulator [Longimicrobiales bacterium]|nr:PadR family transcriptional regulator [Longimicrobiales bacterium]